MEDVLEVYTRSHNPRRPQVCLDAPSKPLVADPRGPLPAAPGQPERIDYDDARQGTAHRFMLFEPLAGQRRVKVTARRTAIDFAPVMQAFGDEQDPRAEKIVLVLDNLHPHKPASLSAAVAPAEARRWWERREIHDTPKHGSWLNMAAIDLSVLTPPCLNRRLPDPTTLRQKGVAWEQRRNQAKGIVNWRFTTQEARIKLKRLDPAIQLG